ncbi:MAG: MoaD/ThiS family protein [Deltaproteobacteria bacterium]|nr:MoaD/ThiS family protein [Deltaproteobacteria bacterium]
MLRFAGSGWTGAERDARVRDGQKAEVASSLVMDGVLSVRRTRMTLHFASQCIARFDEAEIESAEGAAVTDLLDKLHIPLKDVGIVVVNARSGTFQQKLQTDDRITLIPPIGGG